MVNEVLQSCNDNIDSSRGLSEEVIQSALQVLRQNNASIDVMSAVILDALHEAYIDEYGQAIGESLLSSYLQLFCLENMVGTELFDVIMKAD